jgi:fatty acid desaturase
MKQNLAALERDVRGAIIAPLAFLATLAFGWSSPAGIAALALAVFMFVTAWAGYCPAYDLLQIHRSGVHRDVA